MIHRLKYVIPKYVIPKILIRRIKYLIQKMTYIILTVKIGISRKNMGSLP